MAMNFVWFRILFVFLLNFLFIYNNSFASTIAKEQHFIAGEHFKILPQNLHNSPELDKLFINNTSSVVIKPQVIMFFSYGCLGCRQVNKEFNKWERSKGSKVVIHRYPVSFNKPWESLAKFYYTHQEFFPNNDGEQIFTEIYNNNKRLWLESEMINFYEKLNIPKDQVLKKYNSFDIDRKVKKATEIANYYKIGITPNIIVNGKNNSYMVNFSMVPDPQTLLQVVNYLLQKNPNK